MGRGFQRGGTLVENEYHQTSFLMSTGCPLARNFTRWNRTDEFAVVRTSTCETLPTYWGSELCFLFWDVIRREAPFRLSQGRHFWQSTTSSLPEWGTERSNILWWRAQLRSWPRLRKRRQILAIAMFSYGIRLDLINACIFTLIANTFILRQGVAQNPMGHSLPTESCSRH